MLTTGGPEDAPQIAPWRASRTAWFAIFASMAAACILYRVVVAVVPAPPAPVPGTLRTVLYVLAVAMLLGAIAWSRGRLDPGGGAEEPEALKPLGEFMAASVVAMALAEGSAILGLVLVLVGAGTPAEYLAFGGGAFLVLVLVILPRGLRYWAAWESGAGGRS